MTLFQVIVPAFYCIIWRRRDTRPSHHLSTQQRTANLKEGPDLVKSRTVWLPFSPSHSHSLHHHLQLSSCSPELRTWPRLSQMVLNSGLPKQIIMYTTDLLHLQHLRPRSQRKSRQVSQACNNKAGQAIQGSDSRLKLTNRCQKANDIWKFHS